MSANLKYIPPIVAVVFSVGFLAYGMSQPEHQAYSFPNLFLAAIIVFSVLWLINIATEKRINKADKSPPLPHWKEVVGGVVITVFYLAVSKWLGFLVSSFLLFFVIGIIYRPNSGNLKGIWTAGISAAPFLAVIYGLFNVLLQVQTPEGLL